MGGIAYVSATKAKLPVRLKDIASEGIKNALNMGYQLLNKRVKRKIMRHTEMQAQMSRITGTTDYSGFKDVDFVIEAVFENLSLKQQMVSDTEAHCSEQTIFASNTSSIPIVDIAANAKRPDKIESLVCIIFHPLTRCHWLKLFPMQAHHLKPSLQPLQGAKAQGKTPIVVKDGAGFYVNRILAPYMIEAAQMILNGEPIDKIDRTLVKFGFPVGPVKSLDEVGIDVGTKIIPFLHAQFGDRFISPDAFSKVLDDDRKGKKNSRGFYDYSAPEQR